MKNTAEPGWDLTLLNNMCFIRLPFFPLSSLFCRGFIFLLNGPKRWFIMTSLAKLPFLFFCKMSPMVVSLSMSLTFFPLLQGLCTVTAAFLHFFFLASFCWVLTEAWQSYLAVIGKMRSRLIRKRFLCLGWGELPQNHTFATTDITPVKISNQLVLIQF